MSDCINREQTFDAVKTYWKKVVDDIPKGTGFEEMTQSCDMALEHNANILKAIKQLPPARQWIPVEERLPEDGVYVLICDGEHFKDYDCKNGAYSQIAVGWTEQGEFRCWDDRTHMSRVIAWMPLPEPYKDGDDA